MASTPLMTDISGSVSIQQVREAHKAELEAIACYRHATNYLAATQIYL